MIGLLIFTAVIYPARQDGDQQIIIKIDLVDVKKGKIPDVEIKPGDRIHVPETWL